MAVGILGQPLLKGNGEVITTEEKADATPLAGLAVQKTDGKIVPYDGTTVNFNGFAVAGQKATNQASLLEVAVVRQGYSIPVQIDDGASDDLTGAVYLLASGKVTDVAGGRFVAGGVWASNTKTTAIDDTGAEVPAAIIDLTSNTLVDSAAATSLSEPTPATVTTTKKTADKE